MRYVLACVALTLVVSAVPASAQCSWDPEAHILSNGLLSVSLPAVGQPCEIAIRRGDESIAPRVWYYCVADDPQGERQAFRSSGTTLAVEVLEQSPRQVVVRTTSATDDTDDPDRGRFVMTWTLLADEPAVRHEMTFTPRKPFVLRSYYMYVATEQAAADTHRLVHLEDGVPVAEPAQTTAAYGRVALPTDPAWAALERIEPPLTVAVSAPPADVSNYTYSIEFKRFELQRQGGYITPGAPLHDFALIAAAAQSSELVALHEQFVASVERPEREAEPRLPPPDLTASAPEPTLSPEIDPGTGALSQINTPTGPLLRAPGGVVFIEGAERSRIEPATGQIIGPSADGQTRRWEWRGRGLRAQHRLRPSAIGYTWEVRVHNDTDRQRLLEVRLELPLAMRAGYCWDGLRLVEFDEDALDHELTTLVPGGRQSQGIFPAVCVHDDRTGLAVGLEPMQIESFYGARLERTADGGHTLSYVLRWALPPSQERTARFVLYGIDPRWSWRSCIARYWAAWPEVFAAPTREDIWGLYCSSGVRYVYDQGDRFIERCRRLRVGGMELYAPFNRTGDFYPDDEPAFERGEYRLNREQVRAMYETANLAACNLSYVIPTKCERETARTRFADSVIRQADGSMFLRDYWDVMGGGREKLAAMFAWGNSFGKSLHRELREIVENYAPDGFYFDNGAFTWLDYDRATPWTAFDDEGRIYTNAGIPYAKLQDMLAEFAPDVHRNPGEFIQYFSGFRANSHLTNIVGSQRYYVRSHRLIMGYKPIFPGHPDRFGSRQAIYDVLELGGLPWLSRISRPKERLVHAWAPIAIALARAGWRPVTDAVSDDPRIRVERFGDPTAGGPVLFTVRNRGDTLIRAELTIRGELPTLRDFFGRVSVEPQVAEGLTRVTVPLDAGEMIFLTTAPVASPRRWPAAEFLARAESLSIVAEGGDPACLRMARRVRGFVLVQAEALQRDEPSVEIVTDLARATRDARVIIRHRGGPARIGSSGEGELIVGFGDEPEGTAMLSDFLDTIAAPLNDQPAAWLP